MIKEIKRLIGEADYRLFLKAVKLLVADALFHAVIYSMLFLVLLDLVNDSLTSVKISSYTVITFVMMIVRFFVLNKGYYAAQADGARIVAHLRIKMGDYIRKLNMGFFNKNNIGELTNTLTNDLNDFETLITHMVSDFIKYFILTIYLAVCLLFINPMIGWLQMLSVILTYFILKLGRKQLKKVTINSKKVRSGMLSNIIEYVNGISVFKSYNMMGSQFERLNKSLSEVKKESIKVELSAIPYILPVQVILMLSFPLSAYLATQQFFNNQLSMNELLIYLVASISFMNVAISWAVLSLESAYYQTAVQKLLNILDLPEISYETTTFEPSDYAIRFQDVAFGYLADKAVLEELNFEVKQGEMVALIGASGSGKSTVLNLLARFWDPTRGEILIGNQDIKTIYPDSLLSKISMVFQDVYLLQDTIFENIRIGNPKATVEEVIQAAQMANCHEFIRALPDGYETMLHEGGAGLSGGEKQRISIARAFLKDAPIILLDEATASLDIDNEAIVQQSIQQLVTNKTVMVIAHRLNTIRKASKIILLENGRIIEAGSHDDLLKQQGKYYQMFQTMHAASEWSL
ncbi:ATP-binding cassette, subfamily B, bacterial [Enterococcus sp. DIV2402]|uniref:ATP-binding cassette, subfamily B, bacterial n=1 Tax=Candidatus Enterococcus lowellii TaxID=2230877 RepID=A0ABZ2SQD2_9ENTE|nr:ABC transporter ATP-binding protein [Enterococcus sp. DIV2402]